MSHWKCFLVLPLCGFLAPGLLAGEAPTPEELVRRLGADDFDMRQEAAEKLEALGEKARAALLKARRSEVLEIRATAERLLTRLKSAQLFVQVVDEDGKPCPKLSLTGGLNPMGLSGEYLQQRLIIAGRPGRGGNESLETDADGIVRLESDQAGPHMLNLNSQQLPYWSRTVWQPQNLDLRSGENRMFWVQPRGATVKGRVVSAKTGEPIADAEVMVRREDGASPSGIFNLWSMGNTNLPVNSGSADAKGEFSIANVTPASLRVFARHNDYAPAAGPALIVSENRAYSLDEPIKLVPKTAAWGKLRVQVLEENGKPAKGAKAWLRLAALRSPGDEPNADAMGGQWMVWQRRFQNRQPVALNANDEGWVESELMEPGPYRLVLQTGDPAQGQQGQNVPRIDFGEVQVKAGETVSLSGKPVSKSGSLSCRLKSDEQQPHMVQPVRVFALRLDDPDVKLWMSQPAAMQPWILNMLLNNEQNAQYVHMPNQEVELRNLTPGSYALGIHSMRDNRIGWVFGVDIKADERTTVPEIDLTEPVDAKEASAPRTLSGVLLGENGRPIQGYANWSLSSRNSSTSSNTAASFQIDLRQIGQTPDSLTFTCSGYRPFTIDLRKPVPNPNNIVVQLVKQTFGGVTVAVRGPDGAPLEDARVMPISAVRKTPSLERAVTTDLEGRAKLTGLAFGPRQVTVSLDGYYLSEPAKVDIEADQVKELSVTLQTGKTVTGRVVVPAGVDPQQIVVWAAKHDTTMNYGNPQAYWRNVRTDEQGRFVLAGLAPGRFKLRAQAPGFFSEESTVTAGEAGETVLKLDKLSTVLLDLGAGAKGGNLALLKSGTWKPMDEAHAQAYRLNTPLDGNGKAVVPNVAPGSYDLLYTPAQTGPAGRQTLAQLIASGLKVEGGEGAAVRKVDWRPGTSALKFQLEFPEASQRRYMNAQVTLLLESAAACVSINLSDFGNMPQKPWFVKGTPPDGFPSASEAQGHQVSRLPAGEYRVYLRRIFWGRRSAGMASQQKPILLKTVTLKDGETLDLGKLDTQPPAGAGGDEEVDAGVEIGEDETQDGTSSRRLR